MSLHFLLCMYLTFDATTRHAHWNRRNIHRQQLNLFRGTNWCLVLCFFMYIILYFWRVCLDDVHMYTYTHALTVLHTHTRIQTHTHTHTHPRSHEQLYENNRPKVRVIQTTQWAGWERPLWTVWAAGQTPTRPPTPMPTPTPLITLSPGAHPRPRGTNSNQR